MKSFKEWLKLNEMPLGFYGTHFNNPIDSSFRSPYLKDGEQVGHAHFAVWDTDSFTHRDKVLLSAPKTQRKLFEKLKLSRYNINIIPYENFKIGSKQSHEDAVNDFIRANNVQLKDHITFIKKSSTGHMLKPKMLLHTLGHAVSDLGENYDLRDNIIAFFDELNEQAGAVGKGFVDEKFLQLLQILFVFDSVKNGRILSNPYSELVNELIAEYLWSGDKIRIRPDFRNNFKKIYFPSSPDSVIDLRVQKIRDIINNISNTIKTMLDNCVGKIIYD